MLYVTHDQVEALSMASRMAVMDRGAVLQVGSPREVYERPATVFVARFVGSPPMNVHALTDRPGFTPPVGPRSAQVGWRPPHGQLSAGWAAAGRDGLRLSGRLDTAELLGEDLLLGVAGPWGRAGLLHPAGAPHPAPGEPVEVHVPRDRLHWFDDSGTRVGHGGPAPPPVDRPARAGGAPSGP